MWNFTDFQIWYDLDQVFNKTKWAWAITDIHHHTKCENDIQCNGIHSLTYNLTHNRNHIESNHSTVKPIYFANKSKWSYK